MSCKQGALFNVFCCEADLLFLLGAWLTEYGTGRNYMLLHLTPNFQLIMALLFTSTVYYNRQNDCLHLSFLGFGSQLSSKHKYISQISLKLEKYNLENQYTDRTDSMQCLYHKRTSTVVLVSYLRHDLSWHDLWDVEDYKPRDPGEELWVTVCYHINQFP